MPYDCAVEVSSAITRDGPKPLSMGELPVAVNRLVHEIKSFERVKVDAAYEGSYEKALLAIIINPRVASDKKAKELLDEMLEAHKKYLPQFFK